MVRSRDMNKKDNNIQSDELETDIQHILKWLCSCVFSDVDCANCVVERVDIVSLELIWLLLFFFGVAIHDGV